jgi:hypothetical protein
MLIFFSWWFPRTWRRGNKQEQEDFEAAFESTGERGDLTQMERIRIAGQRAREYLESVEAKNRARAEGVDVNEPPPVYRP